MIRAPRWTPDEHLVPSVLANGPVRMSMLQLSDRCWVVAGLTLAGLTAEEIADRLGCSLRLVRGVRAEDMTQVCLLMQTETGAFRDEARLLRSELRMLRDELATALLEAARARKHLGNLISARAAGCPPCPRCGAPMDRYNTYVHEKSGKRSCRACRAENQRARRTAFRVGVI